MLGMHQGMSLVNGDCADHEHFSIVYTVVTESHRAHGRNKIFSLHVWGSNWGRTGAIRGEFSARRAQNNCFCAVSFGDSGRCKESVQKYLAADVLVLQLCKRALMCCDVGIKAGPCQGRLSSYIPICNSGQAMNQSLTCTC